VPLDSGLKVSGCAPGPGSDGSERCLAGVFLGRRRGQPQECLTEGAADADRDDVAKIVVDVGGVEPLFRLVEDVSVGADAAGPVGLEDVLAVLTH
jgi:hypothetical protein